MRGDMKKRTLTSRLNQIERRINELNINIYVLVYLFMIFLGIAFLRSLGLTESISAVGIDDSEKMILNGVFIVLIGMPLIWVVASPSRATYFLGASPALGMFPELPHLPFLREVTHLMVFVAVLALWRARTNVATTSWRSDKRLLFYSSFLAVAATSVVINYALYSSNWQLKFGVSELLMTAAFGILLNLFREQAAAGEMVFNEMLDGFVHSALIVAGIGLIVIALLFLTPYSAGTTGLGNDTIYGLSYFDRMQLLFPGPVHAGMYFVSAMGLVIYSVVTKAKVPRILLLAFLQAAPWLIMASGGRTARIALVLMLVVCLVDRRSRTTTLYVLPSSLIALAIGFWFQSLPRAVMYFLSQSQDLIPALLGLDCLVLMKPEALVWMSMQGRFFEDFDRSRLIQTALNFFWHSSTLQQMLGNGLRTSGFKESSFPSPHLTFLNVMMELGLVGVSFYCAFMYRVAADVYKVKTTTNEVFKLPSIILLACFACLMLFSLTYEISSRGATLVMVSMLFVFPLSTERNLLSSARKQTVTTSDAAP